MPKSSTNWTADNIQPQNGISAIITGTGGLGFEDALALARVGANVIIAGRNPQKGQEAIAKITAQLPKAKISFEELDLASLKSVKDFTICLCDKMDRLDILINNAGVMVPPQRQVSVDGFEIQFATNYLGHFALTSGLMPLLRNSTNSRVISLSSVAARQGAINFADFNSKESYNAMQAYSQSKLACLMFALELHRHSVKNGWNLQSMAAHPGVSRTDLLHNAPGRNSVMGIIRSVMWFMFQPAAQGALPTLYAATSPEAKSGNYYGPDKFNEIRGYPTIAKIPPQALDSDVSEKLWKLSGELTGLSI